MKKETKQLIAGLLGAATVFTTSACASEVECNIDKTHSHTYTTEEGYSRQIKSELEYVEDFYRREEYKYITEEEIQKLRKTYEYNLIRIDDNIDKLLELESTLYDYKQYEYKYTTRSPRIIGPMITYSTMTHKAYTNDKEHYNLTGNERIVTHKFVGYKIIQDEEGNLDVIKSEPMNSIEELINLGYEYMIYHKLYLAYDRNTNEFIGYEDEIGPDKVTGLVLKK